MRNLATFCMNDKQSTMLDQQVNNFFKLIKYF